MSKKLFAVTMGKDYKGSAEILLTLPGNRRATFSRFAAKGDPHHPYAEFEADEQTAATFARETGLEVKAISKSALKPSALSKPAPPVTDDEVKKGKTQ